MGDLFGGGAQEQQAQGFQQALGPMEHYFDRGAAALEPYQQAGAAALPQYGDFMQHMQGQMGGNWMKNFQESPQAKYQMQQELEAANTAAAGSGMLGSGGNIRGDMGIAQQITSADEQNYFRQMMAQNQQYMGGLGALTGMGSRAAGQFAGMAQGEGQDIASMMAAQASARAAGQQAREQGISGIAGDVLGPAAKWFFG